VNLKMLDRIFDPRLLPLVGPLLLFGLWELVIAAQWIKPVLLPPPGETLAHLWTSLVSGAIKVDFMATLGRTLAAFGIAVAIGVPLGVVLGSSVNAYRSVEFLIDFFRSTPSSALIPLFLLIFGITDANKIAIAAFAAVLLVLFNSAYGVMNAKKTRVMAAQILACVQGRDADGESGPDFRGPAHGGVDVLGDRHRGRDVHRLRDGAGPSHH
jgi:ABC-type nitrate/sulfonate/bicarbonate transport system permease component